MLLEAPHEMGHPQWSGQRLRITCEDVLLFKWTAWGHSIGAETLDAWREAPPDTFSAELKPALDMGIRPVAFAWVVLFHSGSHFVLLCDDVNITVVG